MSFSRRQRAAAAGFGFLIVTLLSLMLYYYNQRVFALVFELSSAAVYSIWVSLGKDSNDDDDDDDDQGE
jgi:hypothetical protein